MSDENPLVLHRNGERLLTHADFKRLADVPPEVEWFANIQNPNTRRAYQNDLCHFMRFAGIVRPTEFRAVTRAHVIAWRKELERQTLPLRVAGNPRPLRDVDCWWAFSSHIVAGQCPSALRGPG